MLNKKPVINEEMTLSRYTYTYGGHEMSRGDVGTVVDIEENRVKIEFVYATLPGNNPDAEEIADHIWLEFDELVDYIEGYHWEDPKDEES